MDRQEAIEILLDHYENPRHRRKIEEPYVSMPGGNPGCGDVIMVYLKAGEVADPAIDLAWEGEGCTISQSAASILSEMIHDESWTLQQVLDLDYEDMMDLLGREVVQTRTRCATLALGTLKAAIRLHMRNRQLADSGADLVDIGDNDLEAFGLVIGDAALKPEQ